ncbi:MAG: prenyltransferase [Chloroflexi bacterium]|nr:prenyltransferase [Chloroflexota bacterium]
MNIKMWLKALKVIPRISKEEWDQLDLVSRWLIATRAAVLVMTLTSALIAGLLAALAGAPGESFFSWWRFVLVAVGLYFAHATNNLVNDLTDYRKGVDKNNYYRTQYGPQPLESGLLTIKQDFAYITATGAIAALAGLILILTQKSSPHPGNPLLTLGFMLAGVIFVLFYTWPLKYIALGELTVFLVWGPLMVGGGFYAITGLWSWAAAAASLPYALATVTVIFGKHIDKRQEDKEKKIYTLPVLLGEKVSRTLVLVMMALQYILPVLAVVLIPQFYSWIMLLVLVTPLLLKKNERETILYIFTHPRPVEMPPEAKEFWPLWYVAAAFIHTRIYGGVFVLAMILQTIFWNGIH